VGAAGIYYAFFSCIFLFLAGAAASWNLRKRGPIVSALWCIALICVSIGINLLPTFLYRLDHKRNSEAVERNAMQVDLYGLKISQLLLPITDHRLSAFAKLKEKYNKAFLPVPNETNQGGLGLVGSAGFLFLIMGLFLRRHGTVGISVGQCLAFLNVAAVLLATVGGFGPLFGFLVTPLIRGYNRISVFIAFFSFFGLALILQWTWIYLSSLKWGGTLRWALPASVLFIGLFDQTSQSFIPHYSRLANEYRQDAEFIHRVEVAGQGGGMVYQLPYMPFPESWPINEILHYEPARPYLHSRSLRWSYGAMKGREADLWQRRLREMPLESLLKSLTVHGFAGVWVDRAGYGDHGHNIESELLSLLCVKPLESENERYGYYDLAVFSREFRDQYSDDGWKVLEQKLLNPIMVDWHKGFYTPECITAENIWRWCMRRGEINILNASNESRTITLQMTCGTLNREPSRLEIESDLFSADLQIDETGRQYEKTLTVPPGKHTVRLFCDGPPVVAANDYRDMVFRIINFTCREED
jgi:phosphoglycerol transferase